MHSWRTGPIPHQYRIATQLQHPVRRQLNPDAQYVADLVGLVRRRQTKQPQAALVPPVLRHRAEVQPLLGVGPMQARSAANPQHPSFAVAQIDPRLAYWPTAG